MLLDAKLTIAISLATGTLYPIAIPHLIIFSKNNSMILYFGSSTTCIITGPFHWTMDLIRNRRLDSYDQTLRIRLLQMSCTKP